jgi:hypothetical protein
MRLKQVVPALAILALAVSAAQGQKQKAKFHRENNVTVQSINWETREIIARRSGGGRVAARLGDNFSVTGNEAITLDAISDGMKIHCSGKLAEDQGSIQVETLVLAHEGDGAEPAIADNQVTGLAVRDGNGIAVKVGDKTVKCVFSGDSQISKALVYDPKQIKKGSKINLVGRKRGESFTVLRAWVTEL